MLNIKKQQDKAKGQQINNSIVFSVFIESLK
jgi:hypothetical protein